MSPSGRLDRLASALDAGRVLGPLARRGGRGLLVLNYHRIGAPASSPLDRDLFSATPDGLEEQLAWLARNTEVVDPAELEQALRSRGSRRVLLTFDDGYRDNHEHALPALRRHGLRAAFFIATGFVDEPRLPWWDAIAAGVRARGGGEEDVAAALGRYKAAGPERAAEVLAEAGLPGDGDDAARDLWMTWDMVRGLRAHGMTLGGHTVNHPVLARLPPEEQEAEIAGCLERIAAETGERPVHFSYPVGLRDSFDATTRAVLAREGVRWAYSYFGGVADPRAADLLAIPRTSVHHAMSRERFRALTALPRVYARW
jgi:peptidoglycan/xylan/chitin deacetylase (PgdA/CDA1 family)